MSVYGMSYWTIHSKELFPHSHNIDEWFTETHQESSTLKMLMEKESCRGSIREGSVWPMQKRWNVRAVHEHVRNCRHGEIIPPVYTTGDTELSPLDTIILLLWYLESHEALLKLWYLFQDFKVHSLYTARSYKLLKNLLSYLWKDHTVI